MAVESAGGQFVHALLGDGQVVRRIVCQHIDVVGKVLDGLGVVRIVRQRIDAVGKVQDGLHNGGDGGGGGVGHYWWG